MSYKNKFTQLAQALLFTSSLTLISCGGGGGDPAPSGGGLSAVEYSGSTAPADVSDTNTQSYAAAIMDGSQDSQDNLGNFGLSILPSNTSSSKNKQHSMLTSLVKHLKSDIEENNNSSNLITGILQPPVAGTCIGKEGSFTVDANQTSTGSTASVTYDSYCEDFAGIQTTISGSLTADIVFSPTFITSMNITVPRLTISTTDGVNTYTNEFSGSISVSFDTNGDILSMTVSMDFIENGKIYRLSGLSYTTSGADISISGTIFHPDYGSVTFATTEPFALVNDELCGGTLAVTGVNSNFTVTANADCSVYTYSGTNNLDQSFSGILTSL